MGLATTLGYTRSDPGPIRRWVHAVGSTAFVSKLSSKVLPSLDRLVLRVSGGRATTTSLITGLPVIWLTTTGNRSGLERTVPLLGFPVGDAIGLVGTGFGQQPTPGWVLNLEADARGSVSYRGVEARVLARAPGPAEAAEIWRAAAEAYPGYSEYSTRASHRRIRLFVIDSDDGIGTGPPRVGS